VRVKVTVDEIYGLLADQGIDGHLVQLDEHMPGHVIISVPVKSTPMPISRIYDILDEIMPIGVHFSVTMYS
jgi:hypothetical protein